MAPGVKDVNEVLTDLGMGRYQWVQVMSVCVIYMLDGAEVLVASAILDSLQVVWGMEPWLKGAFVSIIFIGVFVGNALGGFLADGLGRRPTVLSSCVGVVTFGLLSSQAKGPLALLLARFCFGMMYGVGTGAGVTLCVESVPPSWRGNVVTVTSLCFVIGEIFAAILLMIFMPQLGAQGVAVWRWVTALAVLPGLLAAPLMLVLVQESPHFLASNGRQEEALAVLRYIASVNGNNDAMKDVTGIRTVAPQAADDGQQASAETGGTGAPSGSGALAGAAQQGRAPTARERLAVIFSPDYRSIVLGGSVILFTANFNFFGLMYALPIVFAGMHVPATPAFQVFVTSLFALPGVALAWFLIRSREYGHRDSLCVLAIFATIALFVMVTLDWGSQLVAVSLPAAYLAKYSIGAFFTLSYVYLSEVFPTAIRATAFSLCIATGRLGSILAPSYFENSTTPDAHMVFFLFCGATTLASVFVIRTALYFERKNEPLDDVSITAVLAAAVGAKGTELSESAPLPLTH